MVNKHIVCQVTVQFVCIKPGHIFLQPKTGALKPNPEKC